MSPTTYDADKEETKSTGQAHKSLTLKKVIAYVCVVIIVVTLSFSCVYLVSQL